VLTMAAITRIGSDSCVKARQAKPGRCIYGSEGVGKQRYSTPLPAKPLKACWLTLPPAFPTKKTEKQISGFAAFCDKKRKIPPGPFVTNFLRAVQLVAEGIGKKQPSKGPVLKWLHALRATALKRLLAPSVRRSRRT